MVTNRRSAARRRWVHLGVLCAGLLSSCTGEPKKAPPPPHRGPIVLITLDALRADTLGALGGPEALTPHLDAAAAEAHWSGRAVAASSWTVPSMASIFSTSSSPTAENIRSMTSLENTVSDAPVASM